MRTAKVFKNGRSQAVRLPKEYRFDTNDVYVKKFDDIVMLFPKQSGWKPLLDSLDKFSDDFMSIREQPEEQKRELLQ
jgi:antitoxin VapB